MAETVHCTIDSYADFFFNWYGLRDGTMLPLSDPAGSEWVKAGGQVMTVEEFNANR